MVKRNSSALWLSRTFGRMRAGWLAVIGWGSGGGGGMQRGRDGEKEEGWRERGEEREGRGGEDVVEGGSR